MKFGFMMRSQMPLNLLKLLATGINMATTSKKKYEVEVEIIRSYKVKVEAISAGSALEFVNAMTLDDVDTKGSYVDTAMSIHEVECVEEN